MSYNISHARRNWPWPNSILKSNSKVKKNLNFFAKLFNKYNVDIAGMQEIENKAIYGNINHVAYLAQEAGFNNYKYGVHANGHNILERIDPYFNYSSGTAILSRLLIDDYYSHTFKSGHKFKKGYVSTTMNWPGNKDFKFRAVSAHLDFSSKKNRTKQISEMINYLSVNRLPMIIMGDFNSRWNIKNSPLRILADTLYLSAYWPEKLIITLPARLKRADWILISPEFYFLYYYAIKNLRKSDHRPVVAKIGIKK